MTLLELEKVDVFYGDLQACFGVTLRVEEGETVAVIGANGAGKSTLLHAIIGLTPTRGGALRFAGESVVGQPCDVLARKGIALVPEGRRLFGSLSVEDNLLLGAAHARKGPWSLERAYTLFPAMRDFRHQTAAELSGGQQQMVAIGRALMTNPRLLLCDELSLGLAPKVVSDIYACFDEIRATGVAIVVVEQDTARARAMSNQLYCLLKGKVTLASPSREATMQAIAAAYFGERLP
jgi:branched-chain amino acid transport system ATP-binding protein